MNPERLAEEVRRVTERRKTYYQREFEFFESLGRIPHAFVIFDKTLLKSLRLPTAPEST